MTETTKIAVFKGKKVRKTIYSNEWYFSIVDIIEALTDSDKPRDYWYRMKEREKVSSGVELSTLCRQLKLPFKRWLARVGYERMQEIEDPELATNYNFQFSFLNFQSIYI